MRRGKDRFREFHATKTVYIHDNDLGTWLRGQELFRKYLGQSMSQFCVEAVKRGVRELEELHGRAE